MNPHLTGPLLWALFGFVVFTAGISIVAGYASRPALRASFPGGPKRYLAALAVQALGFVLPIPFVWVGLYDMAPRGINFVAALGAGVASLALIRLLPGAGTLLTDLAKTRQAGASKPRNKSQ